MVRKQTKMEGKVSCPSGDVVLGIVPGMTVERSANDFFETLNGLVMEKAGRVPI